MRQVIDLSGLRAANVQRLPQFKNARGLPAHDKPDGSDWRLSGWSNALAGEVGEACNIIKKIERGDCTLRQARAALTEELADILIYLDLLAYRAGIDLDGAAATKFNRVSERMGCDVKLRLRSFTEKGQPS